MHKCHTPPTPLQRRGMNCQFPFDNRCYEIKQQKILDIRSNNAGCLHHYLCLIFVVLRIGLNVLFFDWLWLAFICPSFILGGAIVWKISKNDNWKKLAILEILIANLLLISTMAILCIGSDGMTSGYAFMFSIICILSSILPILLCCYLYKRLDTQYLAFPKL